ncbi:D-erythronate dehydrogenase [Rubellimicrobium thermophilum]|uniref:D-erythronate dehydrogenase n=1 Tax=Rubellimicrobium thermophilum TaxID=295419 RepID=UPI00059106D8|nr:D-erythronate dehydrogenase [Rubellimicrobium thermophilum]
MKVLILGAAGMIGRKLAARIAADGTVAGRPVSALHLADVTTPPVPAGLPGRVTAEAVDLASADAAARLLAGRPDLILHLAAVVSGEAETDFDKGYAVNLDGTRALLEAVSVAGDWRPRLVFASSLAVFGPPFPARIPDDFAPQPATSYGTQKLICELLINDYTRRGLIDGLSLRLPTICIRPGAPNRAASGFFSAILREPLAGLPADLPVPESTRHYFASPRSAVGFFLHAAALDTAGLDHRRALVMPGLSATVEEQIEALRAAAGDAAVARIRRSEDPLVARIVAGWGADYEASRARSLGFTAETAMDQIVAAHVEDELGGRIA